MKKFIFGIIIFIVLLLVAAYGILFTGFGNNLIKPTVEHKINKTLKTDMQLETFRLTPSHINLLMKNEKGSIFQIEGQLSLLSKNADLIYKININKNDSIKLKNYTLNGQFSTAGTINGSINKTLTVKGQSNIANSDTQYTIILKNSNPKQLTATIKHLNIKKLCILLNQKPFANGLLDTRVELNDIKNNNIKSGHITLNITKGIIYSKPINKQYRTNLDRNIPFKLSLSSNIEDSVLFSLINLKTSLGNLNTKKAIFNIKKMHLDSDYTLHIPDLDKLYFITNRHLKGNVTVAGNIYKQNNNINITFNSNIFSGKINGIFNNGKLNLKATKISMADITDMLMYKRFFDSKGNFRATYDIFTKKGKIEGIFNKGHILPNKMTLMIKVYNGFDLTKEIYETTSVSGLINKKTLLLDFDMKSRLTTLNTKKAVLNFDKNTVKTSLNVSIKDNAFKVILTGDMKSPNIKIDATKLIKKRVEKGVQHLINKLFK